MNKIQFQWDKNKAVENLKKHGVSFQEAETVFYDENAVEFYGDKHSEWEDRFLLLGVSATLRLLLICHCFKENDAVVRIISARKATAQEAKFYKR